MKDLRTHMLKKMKNLFKLIIAGGIGFLAVYLVNGQVRNMTFVPPQTPETSQQSVEQDNSASIFEKHKKHCWQMGDEPKAELPGAAIVQFHDGKAIYTTKHILVDAAFSEALTLAGFADKMSDKIDVVALCK